MTRAPNPKVPGAVRERIHAQAASQEVRVTQHAHQEMAEEAITIDEVLQALQASEVVEDYPAHRRGPCCLVHGVTGAGRHLHVVCATARPALIIITVYEPKPPKWVTPTQRSRET